MKGQDAELTLVILLCKSNLLSNTQWQSYSTKNIGLKEKFIAFLQEVAVEQLIYSHALQEFMTYAYCVS